MIVDAFHMFNELDIVELRLRELYDTVDYFIIHESTRTHTGFPKPLYFKENLNGRFKKFWKKIIYRTIDDTPDNFLYLNPDEAKDEWQKIVFEKVNRDIFWDKHHLPYSRDAYEKESIIRSMEFLHDDDIVMFSDADEIPNHLLVENIKNFFNPHEIYNFQQYHYWFYFNCLRPDKWMGNILLSFKQFKKRSVCSLRKYREGIALQDAGWHFSFMGGANKVKEKITNYGEQSINRPDVTTNMKEFIDDCITNKHDFYGNFCNFEIIPIDCAWKHPDYLRYNQDKFKEYIKQWA